MGSFFISMPGPDALDIPGSLFRSALHLALTVPGQSPSSVLNADYAQIATFARRNGSGSHVATDISTGNWLAAIGTWFHRDGYASGQETLLLEDFQKKGIRELTNSLEGFFTICIGDARERTLYVITDIIGSCHCFFRNVPGGVAVSNSSLLLAALQPANLDPIACQEFLAVGVIYEDRTLFREVRKLAPASIYRFSAGALKKSECYWQVASVDPDSLTGPKAAATLWERLTESAWKIQTVFQRPAADLTGGYDSRTLVAALHASAMPITTVVTGSSDNPDVVISKGLAKMANLPHLQHQKARKVSFDRLQRAIALTDGEYDLIEYSSIQDVHEGLSRKFDISINGSFGEVARGYWWELLFPHTGKKQPLSAARVATRRYAVGAYDHTLVLAGSKLDLASHLTSVVERSIASLQDRPNTLQMDQTYLTLRMQRWQGRIASSTNRIWPCLSPFMFRSTLETMLAVRPSDRRGNFLIRRMLGTFSPSWASYPLEDGTPCLPVTWKNFLRFTPLIGFYGRKIVNRSGRLLGVNFGKSAATEESPRIQLWSQEDTFSILRPESMLLNGPLDRGLLASFLERSQNENFAFEAQWNRLFTLECALRKIAEARRGLL
jgi:hypothetical protein